MTRKNEVVRHSYPLLLKNIRDELSGLEFFVKRRTTEAYWKVGKFIHEHLLRNKERADYGRYLFERLAKDVDRDKSSLLRAVQFYRTYPNVATWRQLTWSHYRTLMTVKNKEQRKKLERQITQKKWDTHKLQEYLSVKREPAYRTGRLVVVDNGDKPIPKLAFTRGKLDTYGIIKDKRRSAKDSTHLLDLGFRMHRRVPGLKASSFKEGDFALLSRERATLKAEKAEAKKEEIFTYRAEVNKVIDGDTLTVYVDFGFNDEPFLIPKLRLRGIDSPEMDTEEGKRAKRFVESRLKDCAFIIVKTYKDRSDKYDRYLADVFYLEGEEDKDVVAAKGKFVNQELLDERLAAEYEL